MTTTQQPDCSYHFVCDPDSGFGLLVVINARTELMGTRLTWNCSHSLATELTRAGDIPLCVPAPKGNVLDWAMRELWKQINSPDPLLFLNWD